MTSLNMNERARDLADVMTEDPVGLRIAHQMLPGGARVIDAGAHVQGGYNAGLLLSEICMGGLGDVGYCSVPLDGENWPSVQVRTDFPAQACMASQYAGWAIHVDRFFAMGSGPLRAHARVEKELFEKLQYAEEATAGVLVLEGRELPGDSVATYVAKKAGLSPAQLTFVVAPTASLAGGVQISARILETGLHKMETIGFDVRRVTSGMGTAPIATLAKDDLRAIGRTNDCILYGGQAHYTVNASDTELTDLAARLPASASKDYGTPFYEIFERYNRDFYKIDPLLFSPAEVWLTSTTSGKTYHAGHTDAEVLRRSLHSD